MSRALAAALALLFAPAPYAHARPPQSLEWDQAFSLRHAPASAYFRAVYQDGDGTQHSLEVWRESDLHLRRQTDQDLILYVDRRPDGDDDYRLLDERRGLLVHASRTNLYRIGIFSDFARLAHVVARPAGPYILTRLARSPERTPLGSCRWYEVRVAAGATREICWSAHWALPLRIRERLGDGAVRTVLLVQEARAPVRDASVFRAPAEGYAEVDADEDIDPARVD